MRNIIDGHLKELLRQNKEMSKERMDICKECPMFYKDELLGDRCKECGCRLNAKTRIAEEKCPLNKW